MYAGGLVIGGIPKARVARPVRRVYVIHAPRHHSAAIIQSQGAELMFRGRQIPAGVFAPSRVISALPGAAPPLVLSPGPFLSSYFLRRSVLVAVSSSSQRVAARVLTKMQGSVCHSAAHLRQNAEGPLIAALFDGIIVLCQTRHFATSLIVLL